MDLGFESTAVSAINKIFQHGLAEPFYGESSAGDFNVRLHQEDESYENLSGTKVEEQNQFDLLCDGVESALGLVHESLQGLTNFKDQLLEHALPPPLLGQLLSVTGRIFRSITDFGTPVRELLRLVRVYSAPWDKKSAELIQLFERCSSLERQLDVTVRRLKQMDNQVKRVAKEKSLLNWQKMFFKIMSTEGQCSKGKLQMKAPEEEAGQILDQKQARSLILKQESLEKADHYGGKVVNNQDLLALIQNKKESTNGKDTHKLRQGSKQDQALVPAIVKEPSNKDSVHASQMLVQHSEAAAQTETTKPSTSDAGIWTQEPEFDRFLFVRIFCPEGFHKSQLKCSLSYRGSKFKTPELDSPENEQSPDKDLSTERQRKVAERPHAARRPGVRTQPIATSSQQGLLYSDKRFYEFELPVAESFVASEKNLQWQKTPVVADTLKFAVHHGQFEEIIAFTTLNVNDLQKMKLETVCLPSLHGDDDVPVSRSRAHSLSSALSLDDSFSESVDIPLFADHPSTQLLKTSPFDSQIINKEPQIFPLSSLQSGKASETPCGKIPLLLYWGKRVRPRFFNRQCGTDSIVPEMMPSLNVNESLSRETTMSVTTKMVDEAVSVMACSSATEEETVLKSEYDQIMEKHQQEVLNLHKEYERKIGDLLKSLLPSHTTGHQYSTEGNPSSPSAAMTSDPVSNIGASHAVGDTTFSKFEDDQSHGVKSLNSNSAVPQQNRRQAPKTIKPSKNFKVGRSLPRWGENLPQDFFERLRMWQEGSRQHKQELNERTLKEIKDSLEKKLAGQHKLSKQEEQMYDALKDVCLPALFMPVKLGNVYNPRAHQYFHATGSSRLRLTQLPSMFQLPPIPNNHGMSVMNLFELSKNFHEQGPSNDYLQQLKRGNSFPESTSFPSSSSHTSALTRPVISGEDNLASEK